ncbi:globoside alpha-1,3-N-acetylgalactosaminyltransferase 1-like [Gambusia affinis]|uniref:globoside alpha-1,3-N-acetylgalactosaminyltransferase 1-like n=1 Tax=Gambusia affinis TaxID=33528 RepID=UPI001CDC6232|nr:globoside alpha-1,3-N-acetylgalactosaminyltransferase 1-like [Gambusia affinis]
MMRTSYPSPCGFVPPCGNCYVLKCLPPTPCRIASSSKAPQNLRISLQFLLDAFLLTSGDSNGLKMQRNITKSHLLFVAVFLGLLLFCSYRYFIQHLTFTNLCKPIVFPEKDLLELEDKLNEINNKDKDGQSRKSCRKIDESWVMESGLKYEQPQALTGRTDVNAVTNWNAPLVWERTFDPVVIDSIYKKMDPRIAVVVFAVGKYTRFLQKFIESGEKHFFVGFNVTYYVHTDRKDEVPKLSLGEGRKVTVEAVPSANRWQDVVLGRMKWATITIEKKILKEADYLFMMDIDSEFRSRFGAEALSRLSAVLHRGYYKATPRDSFPYERRPQSKAFIPAGEGDYYYTAAVWGGYLEDMYKLVKYCYEMSEEDAKNKIEAVWQEESHLNRYLLTNKPTKVLSPEYLWSDYDKVSPDIKVVRVSQLIKNYAEVRPNGGH